MQIPGHMHPTLIRRDMRYWLMKPDPRLRSRVHCYFLAQPTSLLGPDAEAAFRNEELLIPDGHSEMVFTLGGAYERWSTSEPALRTTMRSSYLIGGRSHSVVTRDIARVTVAGVKLDPRFLHGLIRTPLTELSDTTVSMSALNHHAFLDLEDAVANAAHCADQVAAVLDRFFLTALPSSSPTNTRIDALLRHIRSHRGAVSLMQWTREQRIDPRHVERTFSALMGMTPKRYARVIRFKHTYHELVTGKVPADTVHLDGYYDRSHFIKEFRSFVGASPRARLNAALPQGTSISDALLERDLATA